MVCYNFSDLIYYDTSFDFEMKRKRKKFIYFKKEKKVLYASTENRTRTNTFRVRHANLTTAIKTPAYVTKKQNYYSQTRSSVLPKNQDLVLLFKI